MIGRCIGLTPDTLLAEDLYRSIRSELSSNASMDNELHWIVRLGLCLPSGTRLTLVLVNIDRLDAWSAVPVARLPDNVRLLASTSGQTIVSGWTGVTLAGNPPGRLPSAWDFRAPSMEAALSDYFDGLERRFPKGLVRLTCTGLTLASAGRFTSGLTKRLTRSCIESHSSGQGHVELLGPLLQYLGDCFPLPLLLIPIKVLVNNALVSRSPFDSNKWQPIGRGGADVLESSGFDVCKKAICRCAR